MTFGYYGREKILRANEGNRVTVFWEVVVYYHVLCWNVYEFQ